MKRPSDKVVNFLEWRRKRAISQRAKYPTKRRVVAIRDATHINVIHLKVM